MGKHSKGKGTKSSKKPKSSIPQVRGQRILRNYGFSKPGDGLILRRMYPHSYIPHDSMRRREVEHGIGKDRTSIIGMLKTGSYPDDTSNIADDTSTIPDNDLTNDYSQTLIVPDTNIRMPINRSRNNGDKLWIDIRIPDNQQKYNLPYFYIKDDLFHSNKIDPLSVIYAYKVIDESGKPTMKKYTPGYGVWEEVKSELFHDDKDTKFYIEYLYNRTESIDEDVDNLNRDEKSRVEKDILLLFRGERDPRFPLTYKYDKEPTYLVDHCDPKYGDPKYGCPISTYIYKSKIPDLIAKTGGFRKKSKKSKKVKKKSKKVKKNVSKRI